MTQRYGIRISQPGVDVRTATPDQLSFSSEYQTLKVHSQGSGSITDSGGRTATIAHGLGYVPEFLVHHTTPVSSSRYAVAPYRPSYVSGSLPHFNDNNTEVWADSTNLYIKVNNDYGWEYFFPVGDNDYLGETNGFGNLHVLVCGNDNTYVTGDSRGGIRFRSISLSKGESIYAAQIGVDLHFDLAGDVPCTVTGIDEDNTADFASYDFSRTKTSSSTNVTASGSFNAGDIWRFGVKSIVDQIDNRSGWSSGNAMGFYFDRNGVNAGAYISTNSDFYSHLRILRSDTLINYKYTIYKNPINP